MNSEKMKKTAYCIFIILFLIMSILPALLFDSKQAAIGNEERVPAPKLSDGVYFPAEFDTYFSRYFGGRNRLVSIGNSLKEGLFKTSGEENVIVGDDGWLFYKSALGDYTGTANLSDREIERAAVVVEMMQDYVNGTGADFVFLIAPNKMSVYPEHMPYYYLESDEKNNYDRLYEQLEIRGINSVALKNLFQAAKSDNVRIYHKLDSHWNNYGAALAYEAVMNRLASDDASYGKFSEFTKDNYHIKANFRGDLNSMLTPGKNKSDEQIYFDKPFTFEYDGMFTGAEDMLIKTHNSSAAVDKRAVLFRDSFGNALYQFFAQDHSSFAAYRQSSYDLFSLGSEADLVVVELVERNIKNLLEYAPVIPSAREKIEATESTYSCDVYISVSKNADGLYEIKGKIIPDEAMPSINFADFYLGNKEYAYKLIPGLNNGDFTLYIREEVSDFISGIYAVTVEINGDKMYLDTNVTLQE